LEQLQASCLELRESETRAEEEKEALENKVIELMARPSSGPAERVTQLEAQIKYLEVGASREVHLT